MPNPTRKFSKSRRDKRRTHYKASPATIVLCQNCGAPKMPHHACPECGYYNGRKIAWFVK
jgi:large subunit ribosomal protein L32